MVVGKMKGLFDYQLGMLLQVLESEVVEKYLGDLLAHLFEFGYLQFIFQNGGLSGSTFSG